MEARMLRKAPLHREQIAVLAALAVFTVAAWAVTLVQMRDMAAMGTSPSGMGHAAMADQPGMGGMEMGDGAAVDPGMRLVLYLGMWTAMMAAMMLPAAAPM